MSYRLLTSVGLGALLLATLAPAAGSAAPLNEPPVFTSQRGALDPVMVASRCQTYITHNVSTTRGSTRSAQRTTPLQNDCSADRPIRWAAFGCSC